MQLSSHPHSHRLPGSRIELFRVALSFEVLSAIVRLQAMAFVVGTGLGSDLDLDLDLNLDLDSGVGMAFAHLLDLAYLHRQRS